MNLLSADTLTGTSVENPQGENLGSIKAIMLDIETGRVAYAVLEFGGFLGIGNKLFAMPWSGFSVDKEREIIILDMPKDKLKNAEGFDQDNWPDMADPTFAARIYTYYDEEPFWEAAVH